MIIITKVEFIDVGDRTEVDLFRTDPVFGRTVPFMATTHNGVEPVYPDECIQKIRGTHLVRADGTTLVIGATEQAQEILGFPFEALEATNRALEETQERWIAERHKKPEARQAAWRHLSGRISPAPPLALHRHRPHPQTQAPAKRPQEQPMTKQPTDTPAPVKRQRNKQETL